VNNLGTQGDCQTSDKLFTVLFLWCPFAVFWRKRFQRTKIAGESNFRNSSWESI